MGETMTSFIFESTEPEMLQTREGQDPRANAPAWGSLAGPTLLLMGFVACG